MTSGELERRPQSDLQAQWGYAKALATAGTLPKAYRDRPGDVLLAMAYGEALGLKVTNVLNGVHIIDGRPSMSSELMQALIRRAGHRIRTQGDAQQATCVIVRRDDPDYAYSVTFTMADARQAKLVPAKPDSGWSKYPAAMLLARAVSACARQACADVLAGVSYTAEELGAPGSIDAIPSPPPLRQPDADIPLIDIPPDVTQAPTGRPEPVQEAPAAPAEDEDTTAADRLSLEWREAWEMDLAQAVEFRDLEAITALANKALGAEGISTLEKGRMRKKAEADWRTVQGLLMSPDRA